ncbi:hypothetical protein CBA19C6_19105 [Cupriavidus pauculus]|nr:hypothetical protein CBA19C6_19105 [Cupriavidus pauculus]
MTGRERAGYLPRAMLLCGIPSRDTASSRQTGAVFVLDVSAPDAGTPIDLLWEVAASQALPLSGSGPIGASMWIEHGVRRWAAVATVAPDDETGAHAGLALLPLDRPANTWSAGTRVRRMALPESGCDATTVAVGLLAVTVASTASSIAQAAYATDTTGRLWRFGLDHLSSSGAEAKPPACLHRQRSAVDRAEAPIVVRSGIGTLVVYGTGNELTAIPDRPGARGSPGRIDAMPKGNGVVLRAARADANPSDDSGTLALPHAGERIDTLYGATAVHVGFTTVAADGLQRSYLIDAASGESVVVADDLGTPGHAITGLPRTDTTVMPIGVQSTIAMGTPTAPGTSTRDGFGLDLWQVNGNTATLQQQARWHQRRGRLGNDRAPLPPGCHARGLQSRGTAHRAEHRRRPDDPGGARVAAPCQARLAHAGTVRAVVRRAGARTARAAAPDLRNSARQHDACGRMAQTRAAATVSHAPLAHGHQLRRHRPVPLRRSACGPGPARRAMRHPGTTQQWRVAFPAHAER